MGDNPWDDPSLASPETKKLREKTKQLRLNPPKRTPPASVAKPGISGLSDAYGQAERLARRNRKIDLATKPLRKGLPGQGE